MAQSFGGKDYSPKPVKSPMARALGNAWKRANKPTQGGRLDELWKGAGGPSASPAATPKPPSPYTVPGADESYKDQPYFDEDAGITKNLDNLKGYIINSGKTLSADYGIDYDGDPISGASNFRIDENVDAKNPFSRAALLKRSFKQATAGNTNSMAARGQLYSGALQNAQNETGWQNQQAQDSLIKDFSGRFGGPGGLFEKWLQGQGDASGQRVNNLIAATGRAAERPAVVPTTSKLSMKQATAKGITFVSEGGRLVAKDSQGKPIPGARVVVTGKTRHVIVPG